MKKIFVFIVLLFSLSNFNVIGNGNNTSGKQKSPLTTLNDQNFRKEIRSGIVVVDFWAVWCGPCKRQAPIFEEAAFEAREFAKFGKCDVDVSPVVASLYNISTIPTIVIFKNGEVVKRFVGITDKATLLEALNVLNKN